jgi:hypothetical protein
MKTLWIDARERVEGTSCDFQIQLKRGTLNLTDRPRRFRVDQLRLAITVPTIQAGANDSLVVRLGSQDYTVVLSAGQKTGPELATELQTRLNGTAPGSWTVAYDSSMISMAVLCTNDFSIVGGTYAAQLMSRPYTRANLKSYLFSYVPVTGIDEVFLCCKQLASQDIEGPGGAHDTILACVVTAPFGSVQQFDMPADVWHSCPNASFQTLSFQLRDRSYKILSDFVPNVSFLLTIE